MTTHPFDFDPDDTATRAGHAAETRPPIATLLRESPGRCVCGDAVHQRGRCRLHHARWLALPYWKRR